MWRPNRTANGLHALSIQKISELIRVFCITVRNEVVTRRKKTVTHVCQVRATCFMQAPPVTVVTPAMCTDRVLTRMTNNT